MTDLLWTLSSRIESAFEAILTPIITLCLLGLAIAGSADSQRRGADLDHHHRGVRIDD